MAEPHAQRGRCIAIVGAESTGKTQLAQALADALRTRTGQRVAWVPELLRGWCDARGRTPHMDEQRGILEAQHSHIDAAADGHDWVVCDTTALMTAVYSHTVFGDRSLEARAGELHRRCTVLTLLTALDLPWVPDGLQRDGPHVRGPVDHALRQLMQQQGVAFGVVGGEGAARLDHALRAVAPLLGLAQTRGGLFTGLGTPHRSLLRWACECCTPEEEQALRRLAGARPARY
jgi:nicotinamide riboside kinase